MTVSTRSTVLRRKVAPHLPHTQDAAAAPDGPEQGFGRAFARAVSETAQLVAQVGTVVHRVVTQSELLDCIDTDAYVALLTPGTQGRALAVLDQSGFSALIEAMTIGRLGPRAPIARRPTPTDASLLADVLDRTLAALPHASIGTQRYDRPIADHRLLAVLLDETRFNLLTLDAQLVGGGDQRAAQLMLALPYADPVPLLPDTGAAGSDAAPLAWAQALEASVLRAPANLRAELGRVTLPLARMLDLGVGSALTLPLSNLEEVQLVALDGAVHAVGRLGQSRGMRAVRLTSWPNGRAPEPKMSDLQQPKPPALPSGADP